MIRTHIEPCQLSRAEADALNRASGERYTQVLLFHWRTYRHTGHWLSLNSAKRWNNQANAGCSQALQAHSIDAAQQSFYKACKTARACRKAGLDTRFPYKRKQYRTTIWKQSGIRREGHVLLLARTRGMPPVRVTLPDHLRAVLQVREVQLVYNSGFSGHRDGVGAVNILSVQQHGKHGKPGHICPTGATTYRIPHLDTGHVACG